MIRPQRASSFALLSFAAALLATAGGPARADGTIDMEVGPHADVRSVLSLSDDGSVESESFRFQSSEGAALTVRVDAPRRAAQDFDVGLFDGDGVRHELAPENVRDAKGRWTLRGVSLPAAGRWELRVTSDVGGAYRIRLRAGGSGRPLRLDLRPGA